MPDQNPFQHTVRSPGALLVLQHQLNSFERGTFERGRRYHAQGRVRSVRAAAADCVRAVVAGSENYDVELRFQAGDWTAACSCPVGFACKHAVAAGLTWIEHRGTDFDPAANTGSDADEASAFVTAAASVPPYGRSSPAGAPFSWVADTFRQTWAPILAAKLGRPLTSSEGQILRQLAALFEDAKRRHGRLDAATIRRHGFGAAIPRGAPERGPVFAGWIPPNQPPLDPWELWQYLAHGAEVNGGRVPEFLRPMTDTSSIRRVVDAVQASRNIESWRRALEPSAAAPGGGTLAEQLHGLRLRFTPPGAFQLEHRAAADGRWVAASQRITTMLEWALPADLRHLPGPDADLAVALNLAVRRHGPVRPRGLLPSAVAAAVLGSVGARAAIVLPDGRPFAIEPEPLFAEAVMSASAPDGLEVELMRPDGGPATGARLLVTAPEPLYWHDGRVWRGPPPLPSVPLPVAALQDPDLTSRLRTIGLRLPRALEVRRRTVTLRPVVQLSVHDTGYEPQMIARLFARSAEPKLEQEWRAGGTWSWTAGGAPARRGPDDPILETDLTQAQAVSGRWPELQMLWHPQLHGWLRWLDGRLFDELVKWRAALPEDVTFEVAPELAGVFGAPLRARMDFSAVPVGGSQDWFDVTVALRVEDTTLTPDEIALLLRARGKWVRLPKHGWQRLEPSTEDTGPTAEALDRLGLSADDMWATGRPTVHRLHALQLAGEADALERRDAAVAGALRGRLAALRAAPPPPLPDGLKATLRGYQREGFTFLTHLSGHGFGGLLADDMGLGKTVQALAWLLHLRAAARRRFRVLVVCPKSVVHGWLAETERFAPGLRAVAFGPALTQRPVARVGANLVVANYTQLRLHAAWLQSADWDAVVLDEGQYIKNAASQVAAAARGLEAQHRLVLTGTPVENRLTDLWSLFAFAQPGLLGAQAAFRRQYPGNDPAALARVHRRVRHFLLRRTKAQAAPDLPARTEDDVLVDLEPAQRKLYDAELKRARQQLLGIESDRALDRVRFNVLASLLRLRQICCHPALVDAAHAALPSAKLDALLERIEELRAEGNQVLVFSQWVEMLELIRGRLEAADIGHLMLTGATQNRAVLTRRFQEDGTKTVFLLSLKAAGSGLNLTAASYVVLVDPWWNPAVEAQAIDRTHRIGQTRPVIAYRLLARGTVEEKIRAMQREKAALAAAVVQEESLASVLDLESLRQILG